MVDAVLPPDRIYGWAWWAEADGPLDVVALYNGREIGRTKAALPREDLAALGLGDCAFEMQVIRPVKAAYLLAQRLEVCAVGPAGRMVPLPMREAPAPAAAAPVSGAARAMTAMLEKLSLARLEMLRRAANPGGMAERLLDALGTAVGAHWAPAALANTSRPVADRVAWLPFPVGLVSGDGSTMLGRDGWLFLVDGPNAVREMFPPRATPATAAPLAAAWAALSLRRRAQAEARGIGLAQVIIPEKVSVLGHLLPTPWETPSCLLAALLTRLGEADCLGTAHVPVLQLLREAGEPAAYRRLDSHLSPHGAWLVAEALAASLRVPLRPAPEFAPRGRLLAGDLVLRFFGVVMAEPLAEADPASLAQPILEDDVPAPAGAHVGARRTWFNPAAPQAETVLVFGNSFSMPDDQTGLCWWLAQYFARVHFVWSPQVDWALVDEMRPAHLICQTVERYLKLVPAS
jgi:hypothetical protein